MAKKLKNYNVLVKALKTAPEVNLRLDFLKKSEKIYELMKSVASDLRLTLTDSKHQMSQLFPDDYQTRTSFPTEDFVTDGLVYMGAMFSGCAELTSLDLSNFDTSKATKMNFMFSQCKKLTSLDLSNFDTSNVTGMGSMFNQIELTSLDLSNFDTSKVTSMNGMFYCCRQLKELTLNFNMINVEDARSMFTNCVKLSGANIRLYNVSKKLWPNPWDFQEEILPRDSWDYSESLRTKLWEGMTIEYI